ncbi:hypothetical protein GBZ26_24955 [Azospirillum formosense]|uniref:Beta-barrel assembly complex subunit BamF n=1 Tax=Azospirillum formosense TaxID=861533 RepID=A0ABX2L266_9PROT|nr:hypothetical protein [Azospirillum formosense]MBY3752119.1 hypothetical protein [Azospirillum formosense]NUB22420.1 hypothetical protein [Azospirillum formosense]
MTPIRSTATFLPVAVALAALALGACATEVHDEMPGRAQAAPPASAQSGGLKTLRQIQAEENARPAHTPRPQTPPAPPQKLSDASQTPNQPPPVRRRGSSSPPPPPIDQPATPALPAPGSTQGLTDRAKRDLMSPEVDRLRTEDAMGRLDPLQQRDLLRKQQDLRQYGPGPLGY